MTAFTLAFIAVASLYLYFHFIANRGPALAGANTPNKVLFENIVPTAGSGEDEIELSFTPDEHSLLPEVMEDAETALLFEAEKLLTEIEKAVESKQEVYEQLCRIVPNYQMFLTTEYYEMINKYIAGILKDECDIELTTDQLEALWII